jgi:hypothetical protein
MRKAALVGAIVGALGIGLVASSAVAAPVGSADLRIEPASTVEKVRNNTYDRYWRPRQSAFRHHQYRRYDDRDRRRHYHHHGHHRLFPLLLLPLIGLALVP